MSQVCASPHMLSGHKGTVIHLSFLPAGDRILSAALDGTVRIWDLNSGAQERCLRILPWNRRLRIPHCLVDLALSPDGRLLAVGDQESDLVLWDLAKEERIHTIPVESDWSGAPMFSPDGRLLIWTAGSPSELRMLDIRTKSFLGAASLGSEYVAAKAIAPDGCRVACTCEDDTIRIWDIASERFTLTIRDAVEEIADLVFSPDGRLVAGVRHLTRDSIAVWDAFSGRIVSLMDGHTDLVTAIAFAGTGHRLFSTSHDNTLRTWDATSGRQGPITRHHHAPVVTLAASRDGRLVATGGAERTIRLWKVR